MYTQAVHNSRARRIEPGKSARATAPVSLLCKAVELLLLCVADTAPPLALAAAMRTAIIRVRFAGHSISISSGTCYDDSAPASSGTTAARRLGDAAAGSSAQDSLMVAGGCQRWRRRHSSCRGFFKV